MYYEPTIGLEIHVELKTKTKMFCNSSNDPDEKRPNVNICPICMGHPGTLPVINKEAVKHVLKVGLALKGTIADFTEFDRKNYFYPDIPKGYQISQYKYPLVSGGTLSGVSIARIHLEEDTARSVHEHEKYSLLDFNRAGLPLMELVTKPMIQSAEHAVSFAKELQLLLRYLGASEANMEKGEMRIEANVSLLRQEDGKRQSSSVLGTKVEIKNLNSMRAVKQAIEYEIQRQKRVLESGKKIIQETRGWDEINQKTFSQRVKEESHDYRYFPDPDLPKIMIKEVQDFTLVRLKEEMPELPWERRERYKKVFGLKDEDIEIFIQNRELGIFFEDVAQCLSKDKNLIIRASNYIISDLLGFQQNLEYSVLRNLKAEQFADLISMTGTGEISSRGAKDILKIMAEKGGNPRMIAQEKSLFQKSNEEELRHIVEKIAKEYESVVTDFKNGKEAALQFLIGQGMKETRGAANPKILKEIFLSILR
jgi:aspartyl-tRNA(Asn)/glutamyl-tRNA(Gln) amidotransferase subunit B